MTATARGSGLAAAALLLAPLGTAMPAAAGSSPATAAFAWPASTASASGAPAAAILPGSAAASTVQGPAPGACPAGPDYYAFELAPTGKVPAVADAGGRVEVGSPDSPFALAVTRDGRVTRRLEVSLDAPPPPRGAYVAWAADPELSTVVRLGPVSRGRSATGEVALNKLLVFVTLEPDDAPAAERWRGSVALVGRSRSARIQSMASHGSFETEDC